MDRLKNRCLTEKQRDIILALHQSELSSRQIAEVAQCAQSTVIRQLQKFQETGDLPIAERRKSSRYPTKNTSLPKNIGEENTFSVNYKSGDKNYGAMSEMVVNEPINEQLNYYQKPIARLSYTNMMEVKHSPSTQMDFRNATNGLPNEEEDEEMNALLDNTATVKNKPTSSLENDSTPILNGNAKHSENDEVMIVDLSDNETDDEPNASTSASKVETKKSQKDLDIFDLDLEKEEATDEKITNGENSVRDTGDDLDTLLSKINDLVEDCMEPSKKVDSPTEAEKEDIVLIDDEAEVLEDTEVEKLEDGTPIAETDITDQTETVKDKPVEEVIEVEISLDGKEEKEKVALETEENSVREEEISEDVYDESGVVVTESDLEIVEEEAFEVEGEENSPVISPKDISEENEEEAVEKETTDEEIITVIETVEDNSLDKAESETEADLESKSVEQEEDANEEEDKPKSEKEPSENMEVDEEIFCLDSPAAIENEDDKHSADSVLPESMPSVQDEAEVASTEIKEIAVEEEIPEKVSANEVTDKTDSVAKEDDDDIFLIEDEDEPVKQAESDETAVQKDKEEIKSPKEEEKLSEADKPTEEDKSQAKEIPAPTQEEELLNKESKEDPSTENVDLHDKEQIKEKKTEVASEKKQSESNEEVVSEKKPSEKSTEVVSEKKPSESKEDDDDDVVCLDDSFEEEKECDKTKIPDVDTPSVDKQIDEVNTTEKEKSENKKPAKVSEKESTEKSEEVAKVDEAEASEKKDKDGDSEKTKEVAKVASQPESTNKGFTDSDIINLDDDDEDTAPPTTKKKDEKSPEKTQSNKPSAIISDNSDNARDGVEEKEDKNEPKASNEKPSETNSNSSSNLLKESTVTERDESRSELNEQPPSKRIRLSQDEANSGPSNTSQEDTNSKLLDDDDVMEINDNDSQENKSLKRVRSSESISSDLKKPKTDLDTQKVEEEKQPELLEEIVPAKPESVKFEEKDTKPTEVKPVPLYPPPNLNAPKIGLSLDFLRRFKKSIHKMNKSDLEELVLQKIVEAIVHKSEFSEMRETIEKQEKIISGHRSKITELNKQFRDLEMVHNRVLKDLETKNSQFIMPVKITRAVGLQVFFPNKKYDQPMAALPTHNSAPTPSPSSLTRTASTSSSTSSIPEKPSISNPAPMKNLPPGTSMQAVTPVGQQPRRGCVQKLTPMRPDGPRSLLVNRGVTAGIVSSTSSPSTPKENPAKMLNRVIASKNRLSQSPVGVTAINSNLPQQTHNLHSMSTPPEPDRSKPSPLSQGIATKKTGGAVKNFTLSKRIPRSWQAEQSLTPQPTPTTTQTVSSPMTPTQSPIHNSSLPGKPPNKSVIDLTDEDDATPSHSTKVVNNTPPQKQATTGMHRVTPYKVSVIPASQLQQQQPQQSQQMQQQQRLNQQKPPQPRPTQSLTHLAPKPNGTPQNAVRRTPPLPQQQRFRHPAPLPNQPIHSSNPLWKLPPARPTIRISNLDSGIVISWTIEDTAKEKYAESTSYQIYAYQETSGPPLVESWRHVGDVKAMLLPMAVTLTQFQEGQRYYFAVRAVDAHNRCGPFSFAKTWS